MITPCIIYMQYLFLLTYVIFIYVTFSISDIYMTSLNPISHSDNAECELKSNMTVIGVTY